MTGIKEGTYGNERWVLHGVVESLNRTLDTHATQSVK